MGKEGLEAGTTRGQRRRARPVIAELFHIPAARLILGSYFRSGLLAPMSVETAVEITLARAYFSRNSADGLRALLGLRQRL
jgi:hypothetical protein